MTLTIKVLHKDGTIVFENSGREEVSLVVTRPYEEGDYIVFACSEKDVYLVLQPDDALGSSFVYLTKNQIEYYIPFGEKKICYSPKVFSGELHLLTARVATKEEICAYKNLACNVMDQHGDTSCYPHATANVETRGESVFAAKNAINGNRENHSHGAWPYESWGINMQDDATMKVEFGRMVDIDTIILYTRSDFPHDNWWKQVTIIFSDKSELVWDLEKSDQAHKLTLDRKTVEWIQISKLIKADDPSPFPALSQIEVYGVEHNYDIEKEGI